MVELLFTPGLAATATSVPRAPVDPKTLPDVKGVSFDMHYAPVRLPAIMRRVADASAFGAGMEIDPNPERASFIVRARANGRQIRALRANKAVKGVFADVVVQPLLTCGTDPPVGDDHDVETLLGVANLKNCGMDGSGVLLAVVDGGVNMGYLNKKGKNPSFSVEQSWIYDPGLTPGAMPVGHGTLCAYNACIAAPACTILDIAALHGAPSVQDGMLSDVLKAYAHLLDIMQQYTKGGGPSLVVTNSWGLYYPPTQDYPADDPSNYSYHAGHPFNLMVGTLEAAGADIVFAAGNCGPECPVWLCGDQVHKSIYGANGHPKVLTVGGVDTNMERVGYSSIGPAWLADKKPDICGYTHFKGSGADGDADTGTSTAAPVVAGVVAAIRSKRPYNSSLPESFPEAIRNLITSTAFDLSPSGFDYKTGYGIVDGHALWTKLCGSLTDLCARNPWLCESICKYYPWICGGVQEWPQVPGPGPVEAFMNPWSDPAVTRSLRRLARVAGLTDPIDVAIMVSQLLARTPLMSAASRSGGREGECGCKGRARRPEDSHGHIDAPVPSRGRHPNS
jgi:hypothetical protein